MTHELKQIANDTAAVQNQTMTRLKEVFPDCTVFVIANTTELLTILVVGKIGLFTKQISLVGQNDTTKELDAWIDTIKT